MLIVNLQLLLLLLPPRLLLLLLLLQVATCRWMVLCACTAACQEVQ
jgi:hypothetical protein